MKRTLAAAALLSFASFGGAWAADPSLVEAVRTGDREAAIERIDAEADVNAPEADGTSALMWATHNGDTALVKRLVDAGADVNHRNDYGASALGEAANLGDTEIIRILLDAGADPDAENPEGQAPLMVVARTGNVDAARLLIKAGADIDETEDWGGQSALMWAAAQSQPEMVAYLIDAGADIDKRGKVRNWQRKITSEPRPKDMNKGGFAALHYAAREGCIPCAEALVEGGADIDITDPDRVTPLNLALINQEFDTAAYLIEAGADIDKWDLYGRTPLYNAIDLNTLPAGGRTDIPSDDMKTGYDIAKMLLEKGADPNIQLKLRPPYRNVPFDRGGDQILSTGATPLLRAAKASDNPAVKLLLEHGALVDLPNTDGITPLLATAGLGHDFNPTRGRFKTEEEGIETLKVLLAAGADINARATSVEDAQEGSQGTAGGPRSAYAGRTAVHGAALKGWTKIVTFLGENGAEMEVVDSFDKTPYDLAAGNYEPGFLQPPPEPFPETMAALEAFIGPQGDKQVGL